MSGSDDFFSTVVMGGREFGSGGRDGIWNSCVRGRDILSPMMRGMVAVGFDINFRMHSWQGKWTKRLKTWGSIISNFSQQIQWCYQINAKMGGSVRMEHK